MNNDYAFLFSFKTFHWIVTKKEPMIESGQVNKKEEEETKEKINKGKKEIIIHYFSNVVNVLNQHFRCTIIEIIMAIY